MNFTQPNAIMTGRVQNQNPQQVHLPSQAPVTSSAASSSPQTGNLQKPVNQQAPINQQTTSTNMSQKLNDESNKNQLPTSGHQQNVHQAPQNNNNHGMSTGISPQMMNLQQHQASSNVNRNVNVSSHQQVNKNVHALPAQQQQVLQQQQIFASIAQSSSVPKGGLYNFQHMQQITSLQNVPYQQQTSSFNQNQSVGISNQSILQKLQASIPPPVHQIKQIPIQQQQQMKTGNNFGPTSGANQAPSQQMQYSPPKTMHQHPQIKITNKLASPGSQLQKSPTTTAAPPSQQVPLSPPTSQTKNVPSIPTTPLHGISIVSVPALNPPTVSTTNMSSLKTQSVTIPSKQSLVTVSSTSLSPASTAGNTLKTVPSQMVTSTSSSPSKQQLNVSTAVVSEAAATKAVEQPKESVQASPIQKSVPKSIEEKKLPPIATEVNSKVDKLTKSVSETAPDKASTTNTQSKQAAVVPSKVSAKSTMRLATVTPARQKKGPATNNKKSPIAAVVTEPQKGLPKPIQTPAKQPEIPKVANVKKPSAQVTSSSPRSAPIPSASTASISSAASSSSENHTTPKTKRARTKVQPYQSPTPELALVTKLSTQIANSNGNKNVDDKLTIFYKNEFLAVRNGEGGFYLCQTMHNIYKSTPKIRIRWLNEKEEGKLNKNGGRTYNLDFYDITDMECVLTTVDLEKVDAKSYELPKEEMGRIESILKKAIDVEKGILPRPTVTEENPDGLDLSLYKDEAQLDKVSPRKRRRDGKSDDDDDDSDGDSDYIEGAPKKKNVKQTTRTSKLTDKKPVTVDESTESDEENLMEIKKKAKSQQITTSKPSLASVSLEPVASTSKAIPAKPQVVGRAVKRRSGNMQSVEIPEKIAKPEKVVPVQKQSPIPLKVVAPPKQPPVKQKLVAKVKPSKKIAEKLVEEKIAEKRPVAKKVTPVVEKVVPAAKAQITPESTPTIKKVPIKGKQAQIPSTSTMQQQQKPATPSTSRPRNTRSKK